MISFMIIGKLFVIIGFLFLHSLGLFVSLHLFYISNDT